MMYESMEDISSGSDLELEDGEIIDDSDSDLCILSIKDTKRQEKKLSTSSLGPRITLLPLKSASSKKKTNKHESVEASKSKENKKIRKNEAYENLRIKIPGLAKSSKSKAEDRPRHKTHRRHRRKSFDKIYEDWGRSIDLLTSPKKRKKSVDSQHKYSSCESLNNEEGRSSKKTCLEQTLSPPVVNGNPLLAKLVRTGDINPTNVVLKEKNGKNVEKHLSTKSQAHDLLSNVSSDESVAHDLILKDFNSSRQYLSKESVDSLPIVKPSSCSVSPHENGSELDVICVNVASESSEVSCLNSYTPEENQSNVDFDSDTILVPKYVSQSYLAPSHKTSANLCDEVYSPETFIPFDFNPFQDRDTLELRDALLNGNDLLSENYDCIPMSCSEDEGSSVDSKANAKPSEQEPQNQQQDEATENNEEDEELRLRISALKTWLQRKYAKSKPNKNESVKAPDKVSEVPETPKIEDVEVNSSEIHSAVPHVETESRGYDEEILKSGIELTLSKPEEESFKSNVETVVCKSEEEFAPVFPNLSPKIDAENSSFLDEEANENYEQALRSLLVSNLLKKKLQNSNQLLTESDLINKASSSLKPVKKPPVISNPSKMSSNSSNMNSNSNNMSSNSSKMNSNSNKTSINSKYRTVNSSKSSVQGASTNKTNSKTNSTYNCDKFQSKFVFNHFYEPPNQAEDNKYLKSISNFKLPVIEKFIIHLSEDSDYDSDELEAASSVTKLSFEEKSAGPSSASFSGPSDSNCSEKPTIKPSMDVPKPTKQVEQLTQPSVKCVDQVSDSFEKSDQLLTTDDSKEYGRILSPTSCGEKSCVRLPEDVAPSREKVKDEVTSSDNNENTKFSNVAAETETLDLRARNVSVEKRTLEPAEESCSSKEGHSSYSSPSKIVTPDGNNIQSANPLATVPVAQESAKVSNSPSAKEKSKKANSALVAEILVPVEKKLLMSRLNLLQNLDSLQSCVGSCEESALKCSKSFAKIIQLQKALKLATASYKTQFKSLKTCLQSYKAQSQKMSLSLSDYAQAQKDCAIVGKQVIGSNYKTPKDGMSVVASKFKSMKQKKLELLNNASIANEIKKANFSTDVSSSTISAALQCINTNLVNPSAVSESSRSLSVVPSITVTIDSEAEMVSNENPQSEDGEKNHSGFRENDTSAEKLSSDVETDSVNSKDSVIIKALCDTEKGSSETSALFSNTDESKRTVDQNENLSGNKIFKATETASGAKSNGNSRDADENGKGKQSDGNRNDGAIKVDSGLNNLNKSLPKPLIVSRKLIGVEKTESDEVTKCQQRFKKYTPFFQSLNSRGKDGDNGDNVDSIICPFGLQGTCRDETCTRRTSAEEEPIGLVEIASFIKPHK